MVIHGQMIMVLMDSGQRDSCKQFTSGSGVIVQSIAIPTAKAE